MSVRTLSSAPPKPLTGATLRRRLLTIPRHFLLLGLALLLSPALLAAALFVDALRWSRRRTPFMASRLLFFALWYLVAGAACLLWGFGQWIASGFGRDADRLIRRAFVLRVAWTSWLLEGARRAFAMRFTHEGLEAAAPGPVLLLVRHTSIVDSLLPTSFIEGPHHLLLRYVVKSSLLAEPCIDLGGARLPTAFVDRDAEGQTERLRAFFSGLGPQEGVLLYPEGTRFSPSRRARRIEELRAAEPARAAKAEALRHLLSPKPGGVLAALDASPEADVAIVGHVGLDGFTRVADIWSGAMQGQEVRMTLTRYPRASLPTGAAERVAWLDARWAELDAWVDGVTTPPSRPPP